MKNRKPIDWAKMGPIVSVMIEGIGPCGNTLGDVKKAIVKAVMNFSGGEVLHIFVPSEKLENGDDQITNVAYIKLRKDDAKKLVDLSKVKGGAFSIEMLSEIRFYVSDRQPVCV